MIPAPSFDAAGALLFAPAIAAINHLLSQEAWARAALAEHAGKEACIDAGSVALRLRASGDGLFEAGTAASEAAPAVTIRLKLADLPLIAQNRERAFSYVKIEGDADFANTLSQLARRLRWEAEADLEPWIGAIAARRLVAGTRDALGGTRASGHKLAENLAEFFLEEQPLLVRPSVLEDYASEVNRLRDDVERAAKRIAKLEQKLAARAAPGTPTVDH
ncbi:MAG: SCP2 sterol-binding domain-containing protein [Pseudomonadota bacterium]